MHNMYLTFDGVHTVPFSLCSFSILSSSGISQPSNVAWLLLGVGRLPLLFSACALPVRGEWRAERGGAVRVPGLQSVVCMFGGSAFDGQFQMTASKPV
jgi:hypothetical protein